MIADRRFRTDGRRARVLHVPLTDAEFDQLRDVAHVRRETIGNLASEAVRAALTLTPKRSK